MRKPRGPARRDRRRPCARDYPAGRPARPDRSTPTGEEVPPRLVAPLTAAGRNDLRARLLATIGNATGRDRQCHLSIIIIAERCRAARRLVDAELKAMEADGLLTRFRRENGQTATMLTLCETLPAPVSIDSAGDLAWLGEHGPELVMSPPKP